MPLLAYMTVPDQQLATTIAARLLEQKLVAGVNILQGARSLYRWQGSIHERQETLVWMQLDDTTLEIVQECILQLHTDETPCLVAIPLEKGYGPFLEWVQRNGQ